MTLRAVHKLIDSIESKSLYFISSDNDLADKSDMEQVKLVIQTFNTLTIREKAMYNKDINKKLESIYYNKLLEHRTMIRRKKCGGDIRRRLRKKLDQDKGQAPP